MARGYTTRKLQVFALHCRSDRGAIDYTNYFNSLSRIPAENRFRTIGDRIVAVPVIEIQAQRVWLVAYEGDEGVNPLIFNTANATERVQRLRSGEVVAHKTHAMIDLASRQAIVEYNHRGAKAHDLATVLEEQARDALQDQSFVTELNPVADESFAEALGRFGRIRVASIRVARPNVDWTDHYNHLTEVARDSNARTMELSLTANRASSLSTAGGVVRFIRDLAHDTLSMFKGARITGTREGESAETTISLANHIEHQKVSVRMTESGHVDDMDIKQKIEAYLAARDSRSRQ